MDAIAAASRSPDTGSSQGVASSPLPRAQASDAEHSPVWARSSYLGFAAILVLLAGVIAVVLLRRRPEGG